MNYQLKKINDTKVRPLKIIHPNPEEIKGGELFPEKYFTVYMVAPPRSGKTTTIYNILKNIMDKRTSFYGFVGTHNCDQSYEIIKKYFDKKDINYEFYCDIKEKGSKKHYLADLIKQFKEEEKNNESDDELTYETNIFGERREIKIITKQYKPKKQVPERVILFDDMSVDLRDPYVNKIIKEFRHYKCVVIISSQTLFDVYPSTRESLNYFLLFKGIENKKIQDLYDKIGLNIGVETFEELYKDATREKYSFLYVSKNKEFRKNFSYKYILNEDSDDE